MTNRPAVHPPGNYELRIDGHLDEHWSAWFGGMTLTRDDDGITTLRGLVTDQAELHGLLAKVRDLGVTLLSVRTIDADTSSSTDRPPGTTDSHTIPQPEGPSP